MHLKVASVADYQHSHTRSLEPYRGSLTLIDVATVGEPSAQGDGRHLETRSAKEPIGHVRDTLWLGHGGGGYLGRATRVESWITGEEE